MALLTALVAGSRPRTSPNDARDDLRRARQAAGTGDPHGKIVAKPMETAVAKLKLVDPAGELVRTAKGIGITAQLVKCEILTRGWARAAIAALIIGDELEQIAQGVEPRMEVGVIEAHAAM